MKLSTRTVSRSRKEWYLSNKFIYTTNVNEPILIGINENIVSTGIDMLHLSNLVILSRKTFVSLIGSFAVLNILLYVKRESTTETFSQEGNKTMYFYSF